MLQTNSDFILNKVAIVTGGSSGLGEAVVLDLLGAGANVVSVDLEKKEISNYEKKINRSIDNNLYISQTDVSNRSQVKDLYKNILAKYKRIDFLFNFAGINIDKPFIDLLDEDWEKVVNIHLKGTFICSQEFAKNKTEGKGHIITVGAACGIQGRKNGANFCSAKGGIFTLTKCKKCSSSNHKMLKIVSFELLNRYRAAGRCAPSRFVLPVSLSTLSW